MAQAELKVEADGGATPRGGARERLRGDVVGGTVPVGPVQYGQSRDVLLRAKMPAGSTLRGR